MRNFCPAGELGHHKSAPGITGGVKFLASRLYGWGVFSAAQKRAKLRVAHEVYAPRAGMPLARWLTSECARLDALVSNGQTISSAAGNGQSVAFSDPERGGSPHDLLELWEEIRTAYDATKAELIESGTASPTDADIVEAMLTGALRDVRSYGADFSRVRFDYEARGVPQ